MTAQKCGRPKTREPNKGQPCGHTAGWGTDHPGYGACKLHGGMSPSGRKHAQNEQARELVTRHALPRDINPVDALLEEVRRSAGTVEWLRAQVEALDPEMLVKGTRYVRRKETPDGVEVTTEAGPGVNLWWRLYCEERDRLRAVCADAIRAGVAERAIRLAERQGELLAEGLAWLLRRLGRAGDPVAQDAVTTMLRCLDGGRVPA